MRTKFWQNYFLGRKGFAKTSADLFLNFDVANGKGRSAMKKSQAKMTNSGRWFCASASSRRY